MSDEMDEIWALYADDGAQALDAMETALLALSEPGHAEEAGHISALFRAVHTFKGNSRVLGLAIVESRAHLAEDLIGLVRDHGVPLDEEIRDILLLTADVLREMLEHSARTHLDVEPARSEPLMGQLRDKIARCTGQELPVPAPEPAPAPVAEAPLPVAAPAQEPAPEPEAFEPDAFDEIAVEPEPDDFGLPTPDPTPAPAPPPTAAPARLIDDPTYRKIFLGMVDEAQQKLRAALDSTTPDTLTASRKAVDGLAHAARQLGLFNWAPTLESHLSAATPDSEQIAALLLDIEELLQRDFATCAAQAQDSSDFLEGLRDALSALSRLGMDFTPDADHVARRSTVIDKVVTAATARGFVRVIEAAQALIKATDAPDYRERELRLYEELAAVEAALGGDLRREASPRALLLNWCADHIFDTLAELSTLMEKLRAGTAVDAQYSRFGQLMRRVHHACQHFRIDTAAQLTMSLLDLFARQQTLGGAPDPILDHIAQGFISTIELVFDSLGDGHEMPQGDALQKLFAEATSVAFVSEGVVSAGAIERKLGLPREFHRVLSPESVRAAAEAMEAGQRFHVIRADINDDETLAESFLIWLGQHGNQSITNVTVFRNADTLFDFLIATPLGEAAVSEAMALMDPSGRKLIRTHSLTAEGADEPVTTEEAIPAQTVPGISPEMLERIGEIATGQAMIHHMQQELSETDIVSQIEARLRGARIDADTMGEVRSLVTGLTDRLRDVVQLEAQLLAQMSLLQEETVALRSRPADTVLQPIAALAKTLARKAGKELAITTTGGELSLDVTILDTLRGVLRGLTSLRMGGPALPKTMRLTFRRDEESVQATIEDDLPTPITETALAPLEAMVGHAQGRLRQVMVPGGGLRLHVSLPLAMVVIEGMVVGIGGVRYVLPVDVISSIIQVEPGAAFGISADRGQRMLRLPSQDVVPVRRIMDTPHQSAVYVILMVPGGLIAIPVDEVVGQQLVLLRPLRGVLSQIRNMTGIVLLAGGEVGMVVSASSLGMAEAA